VHRIHNILGSPPQSLLDEFKKKATHMEFNFPTKKYVGIAKLAPHITPDCQDVIMKMLIYNADERPTASQILKHTFFKDLRDIE
jgi:serine/threonine protein kinase